MHAATRVKLQRGEIQTTEENSANPFVPESAKLFVDELDKYLLGLSSSLVLLSKPITVF